jgi:hypothetical protein
MVYLVWMVQEIGQSSWGPKCSNQWSTWDGLPGMDDAGYMPELLVPKCSNHASTWDGLPGVDGTGNRPEALGPQMLQPLQHLGCFTWCGWCRNYRPELLRPKCSNHCSTWDALPGVDDTRNRPVLLRPQKLQPLKNQGWYTCRGWYRK